MSALTLGATLFAGTSHATDIILSDSNTNPNAGVNQLLNLGDSSSVFVWVNVDPGQTVIGLGLDVLSSDPAVLEATSYNIYETTYFGGFFDTWDGTNPGTLGDLVDDSNAAAVTATGLDPAASFDGTKVDNAFLVGEVSFDATGLGITNVVTAPGNFGLADDNGGITANHIGGTVEVVPEPSSLALLGLGGLLIARRRRG